MKIIKALNGDSIQVSDCDYDFLSNYSWELNEETGYYCCNDDSNWLGCQTLGAPIHVFVLRLAELDQLARN